MHAHPDPAVMQGPAHGALVAAAGFQADDGARRRRVFAEKGDQLGKAGFVIGELPRRAHAAKPNIEGGLGNIDAVNGNKKWHASRVPALPVRAYRPWQLSGRMKGRAVTRLPYDGPRNKHEASKGERSAARAGGGACPTPSDYTLPLSRIHKGEGARQPTSHTTPKHASPGNNRNNMLEPPCPEGTPFRTSRCRQPGSDR